MGILKSSQVEPVTEAATEENSYGQPFKFDPNEIVGPVKKRSCTDVLCLGLFLAFLVTWGFVAFVGISRGDINKVHINLIGTTDYIRLIKKSFRCCTRPIPWAESVAMET